MAPKLISSYFKTTTKLQADASMEREFDGSIANQRVRELEEEKRKEVEKRKRQDERNEHKRNIRSLTEKAQALVDADQPIILNEQGQHFNADVNLVKFVVSVMDTDDNIAAKKKKWSARPVYWASIVTCYNASGGNTGAGLLAVRKEYPSEFHDKTDQEAYHILQRWKRDLEKGKEMMSPSSRAPAYGVEIDRTLMISVQKRIDLGLPVDAFILRTLLLALLAKNNKADLLKENGGNYDFKEDWRKRFCLRHKLRFRVATTKMREKPEDYDAKFEDYVRIGANILAENDIPPCLVVNGDETGLSLALTLTLTLIKVQKG